MTIINISNKIKCLVLMLFCLLAVVACDDENANKPVAEFESLEKRANLEDGFLRLGKKRNTVTEVKILEAEGLDVIADGEEAAFLFFNNQTKTANAVLSIEDGKPDGKFVLIDMDGHSFLGTNLTPAAGKSKFIKDHETVTLTGTVMDRTSNESSIITIFLTQSLFTRGDSTLRINGNRAYLNGLLGSRSYNQIFEMIQKNPEVKTIVLEDVPGSVNKINEQTGRLVRKAKLSTVVLKNGLIASGGVDFFCSGVQRRIEDGATVGVHSWEEDGVEAWELPRDDARHQSQINYFNEMLGKPLGELFYFFTIYSAGADDVYLMTTPEIQKWGLVTE